MLKLVWRGPLRVRTHWTDFQHFRRPGQTFDISGKSGGRRRTRTFDPLIKSQLLYQLSYAPFTNYFNVL
jgi:hypothetical protein